MPVRTISLALVAATLTALAGCGSPDRAADAPADPAAAAAADTPPATLADIATGTWRIDTVATGGAGEESGTSEACLTPAALEQMFVHGGADDACTFPRRVLENGRIDVETLCEAGAGSVAATWSGSYTAASLDYVKTVSVNRPGGGPSSQLGIRAQRIADGCQAPAAG